MKFECKICNKKFETEESLKQHNEAKHKIETTKPAIKKYVLLALVVVALIVVVYAFYVRSSKPGAYDEFAKCLSEKAVVIYGNDFCKYTGNQLNMFGNSRKLLNYIKCIDNKELCDSKKVSITPTWEINGKMYENVQTFERLSELSGCKL